MNSRTSKLGIPISTEGQEGCGISKRVTTEQSSVQKDILWEEYSIQPNLPIRTKIERLMLLWRLPALAISKLLGVTVELVQSEIEELNKEWLSLGKPLDEASRQVVRGRMIAELMRLKADLEAASTGPPDSRLMALKLQVIEKLTKLQGIDIGKEVAVEEPTQNSAEKALGDLSEEQRSDLLKKLKTKF